MKAGRIWNVSLSIGPDDDGITWTFYDEAEARNFLDWARSQLPFSVIIWSC